MFIFKHLYTIIDKNAKKSIKSNNNVTRTSRSTEQGKGDKGEGARSIKARRSRENSYSIRIRIRACKGSILCSERSKTYSQGSNRVEYFLRSTLQSFSLFFKRLPLTIMYLDLLDTHFDYASTMLIELWRSRDGHTTYISDKDMISK